MTVKLLLLLVFFGIMVGVGFYSRKHASNVNDFVLGEEAWALLADGLRLRYLLLFGSGICGIRRAVWMEIWPCIYLDRTWKCFDWKSSGLGGAGTKDKDHDPSSAGGYHAGLFRQAV